MIKEAIELIQKTAIQSSGIRLVKIDGDSRRMIVDRHNGSPDGSVEFIELPAPLRNHKVLGITDFIDAVKKWASSSGASANGPVIVPGVVFHSPDRLVLVVNDADRRDRVTMELADSDTFTFVCGLEQTRQIDHKSMVGILKHNLAGAVDETLLAKVRKIDVSSSNKMSSEVSRGRERGTREFIEELANAADLPEFVDITTSVYSNTGLQKKCVIRCSFDVELPAVTFSLRPLPDEISRVVDEAQENIHQILTGALEDISVFYGEP